MCSRSHLGFHGQTLKEDSSENQNGNSQRKSFCLPGEHTNNHKQSIGRIRKEGIVSKVLRSKRNLSCKTRTEDNVAVSDKFRAELYSFSSVL